MIEVTEGMLVLIMFGIIMLLIGSMTTFYSVSEIVKYGIDDVTIYTLILGIILLLFSAVLLMTGFGILVIV